MLEQKKTNSYTPVEAYMSVCLPSCGSWSKVPHWFEFQARI